MKTRTLLLLPLALALPLACNTSSGTGASSDTPPTAKSNTPSIVTTLPPAASAAQTASAAEAPRPIMKTHAWGPVGALLASAREQTLKDDQKAALDKIADTMKSDNAGPPKEMKELHDALIAGVRAGKIDQAKVDASQAAMTKAMQAHKDKEAEALTTLYKTLDPAQRKAVVAAARAKDAARDERAAKHKAEGANDKDGDRAKRKLEKMTKELDLDPAQQKTVEGLITKNDPKPSAADMDAMRADAKKRSEALYSAFESDSFDAKKVDWSAPKKHREGMQQHVQFLTQLLPVLRPEQREKLAASMDKGHEGHPEMGGGRFPFEERGPIEHAELELAISGRGGRRPSGSRPP